MGAGGQADKGSARLHGRLLVLRVAALLMLCALCLGGWGIAQLIRSAQQPVAQTEPSAALGEGGDREPEGEITQPVQLSVPAKAFAHGVASAGFELHRQYRARVLDRMVPLSFVLHDPYYYEGWVATEDFDALEASSDGLLTEWERDWYVTHDWSWYGGQILALIPHDVVSINGHDLVVDDIFDYPKDSYSNEIRELVGIDGVVLQTCEPDSDLNRIVYGHWL